MNKRALIAFLLLAGIAVGQIKPTHTHAPKPETPHLSFVKEIVRELIEDEDRKTSSNKELAEAKMPNERISAGIYFSKSTQLELGSQIAMLKSMRLKDPFDKLIPTLVRDYQMQIELHQKLIDIGDKIMAPKEGVDYLALVAKMPEIRAELDESRKMLFYAAPSVFISLIDRKDDSQGHANHLLITKDEKADLESQLGMMLKDIPDKGDQDYYISTAMVLRDYLQKKGYKCADEPWD